PREALDELIAAFAGFWHSDRIVIRRIRGLAAIDADFEQAVRARDERRREGLRTILGRLAEKYGQLAPGALDELTTILHTLTSFESFDNLAGTTHTPEEVVPLVCRLTHTVLRLDEGAPSSAVGDIQSKCRSKRCT